MDIRSLYKTAFKLFPGDGSASSESSVSFRSRRVSIDETEVPYTPFVKIPKRVRPRKDPEEAITKRAKKFEK